MSTEHSANPLPPDLGIRTGAGPVRNEIYAKMVSRSLAEFTADSLRA